MSITTADEYDRITSRIVERTAERYARTGRRFDPRMFYDLERCHARAWRILLRARIGRRVRLADCITY